MAKKQIIKITAMAFAIAILIVFVVPATSTLAAENPPGLEDVLGVYPMQQFVLAFDLVPDSTGYEYEAITIPLTYSNLEYLEVPVLTSDGSFTVNVTWYLDPDFDLVFEIDLSEIAQYYGVVNYRLYSVTPNIYLKGDMLVAVACDADDVRYDCVYNYNAPVLDITSDNVNHVDFAWVQWPYGSDVRTFIADEAWDTHEFTLPEVSQNDAFFVTDVQVDISCTQVPTTLHIGLPMMDAENETIYFYDSVFDQYWSPQHRFENPPVYIEGAPDVTGWISGLFGNLFSIELFPGISLGGLLFCFIAIPVALIFLRLFAGG